MLIRYTPHSIDTMGGLSPESVELARASIAESTRRGYASDMRSFAAYCAARGVCHLPAMPGTVADYLASLHTRALASGTIARHMASIASAHLLTGLADPCEHMAVGAVMAGIRRSASRTVRQVRAITHDMLRAGLPIGDALAAVRDRAIILLGFFAARRRSEIAAVECADIEIRAEGALITVRRSKTDQVGAGHTCELLRRDDGLCPVAAVEAWLAASRLTDGPLFRGINQWGHLRSGPMAGASIALIVKACAGRAGADESEFSGHSLRRGLATTAARTGASVAEISEIGGWAPGSKAVHQYIQRAGTFKNRATTRF